MNLQTIENLSPIEIIEKAKEKYNIKKFIGLFSGGKDSLSVCHYVATKLKMLDEVLYLRTGIGTKENFEFVLETCNKFGWKLNIADPKPQFTYEKFVERFGFPHSGKHSAIMGFLKWYQLRQFARDHKGENIAFISGRRKKESKRRLKMKSLLPYENPETNIIFCSPLYYWTNNDIKNYIKKEKLELCPVYATLHMSGDCLCGAFSELGESNLIKTFHPDLAQKIVYLEQKYGGKWGNQMSMLAATKQDTISNHICSECIYR